MSSAELLAYKKEVAYLARSQGVEMVGDGALSVTIHVYRPRRSGDLDNRQKAVLDSLNGILWRDDEQIVAIHAYRHDDKKNPRIELEVEEV